MELILVKNIGWIAPSLWISIAATAFVCYSYIIYAITSLLAYQKATTYFVHDKCRKCEKSKMADKYLRALDESTAMQESYIAIYECVGMLDVMPTNVLEGLSALPDIIKNKITYMCKCRLKGVNADGSFELTPHKDCKQHSHMIKGV